MSKLYNYSEFNLILDELKKHYKIFAPVKFKGISTFSDTDIIKYSEIATAEDINYTEKSDFSPKEVYFPITQTLFHFINSEQIVPELDDKKYIIFMRPCDINTLNVFNSVYIKNDANDDFYYKRLLDKLKIFMLECRDGFDSCFCVTMNTNKTDDYSASFRFNKNEISCEIKSDEFKDLFNSYGKETAFQPEFVEKDHVEVKLPDINKITKEMFNDLMWAEYTKRCIACGRCNFVCPTCTCWSMQDIKYEGQNNAGERRRVWASCHVDRYTDMAGGHSFRKTNGERMRFKVLHKVYDFKKRYGYNMCSGCGRCDDVCPEYISYSNSINKLTNLTEGENSNG